MYSRYFDEVVSKLFEEDPNGAIHAYEDMMKKNIVMPAHLMSPGCRSCP